METAIVKSPTMADMAEYKTLAEASEDKRIPYTVHWLRKLCQDNTVECIKLGSGHRAMWLIHMPSLLTYVQEMDDLGTKKHGRNQ